MKAWLIWTLSFLSFAFGGLAVGFGTTLGELAVSGAVTGLALGVAPMLALPARTRWRGLWAAAMPVAWALGRTVTTLVGVYEEIPA